MIKEEAIKQAAEYYLAKLECLQKGAMRPKGYLHIYLADYQMYNNKLKTLMSESDISQKDIDTYLGYEWEE